MENIQRITHAADGRNTTFDYTMPQAWSLDRDKRSFLEITGAPLPGIGNILADSAVDPLHANIWSAPTPEGGSTAELIDFAVLEPGNYEAARGKWVLYAPQSASLIGGVYHDLAEAGIAGMVGSDFEEFDASPDSFEWLNGNGYCGWYLIAGEKRFPTFSVSPLTAAALRERLQQEKVILHGEMYCKVYDGEIYTVTGTIPGESSDEFALIAHLYEPFVNDDAAGFAFLCEIARILKAGNFKLKKTLRLIFSMELYGTAAYLKEYGANIVLAANCDGIAYADTDTLFARRTPFFCPSFSDWLNLETFQTFLPQFNPAEAPASLSDDTFAADPGFHGGIPTFWLYHSSGTAHHITGYRFAPDWRKAKAELPVISAIFTALLCKKEFPDYSAKAAKELLQSGELIYADTTLTPFEKKMRLQAEYMRQCGRLTSLKNYTGQSVNTGALDGIRKIFEEKIAALPAEEFSAAEYRALNMTVTPGPYGLPFSLAQVPFDERHPVNISNNLWALLDGRRNLLECIRLADAESGKRTSDAAITALIKDMLYAARYGYAEIARCRTTADEFAAALKTLGVAPGMKLVVHSTFSSLGEVPGGPEAICKTLQDAVTADGVLLMPSFTFQVYHPGKRNGVYDVKNTPSTVGILTETFRKMPDVARPFDPCHSFAVWGRNTQRFVEKHHLVPTIDRNDSPLGILAAEDGWCLTVSSASSVTYMHLVEESCGATCCDKRTEEYHTILPDGKEVLTRAWGWRETTCKECPAERTPEVFELMRKNGTVREVKLHHASLKLFKLSDYAKAYGELLKAVCPNNIRPRQMECTVKSDWDETTRSIKKETTAYTGKWFE
ncbi:MAG: AAC(3) family N-acetyltransferase [Lentisphaeria bacterium]|nr:AAC(3) family N-acetyltransferase [Lentisphaeria bacterium]